MTDNLELAKTLISEMDGNNFWEPETKTIMANMAQANTQIAIAEQLKRIADVLEDLGNSEGMGIQVRIV